MLASGSPAAAFLGAQELDRPGEDTSREFVHHPSLVATRMTIPRIGVDAPLVDVGITPDGYMDTPGGPAPVGWFEHGARPGEGSNAVFTGHVDYIRSGPAVFWSLSKLCGGDAISVTLIDGSVIDYAVTSVDSFAVATLDMAAVLAPARLETVTLITCGGAFSGGEYDHRVVVRAVKTGARVAR